MSQSFESMTAPLPDEPIGLGARWEVITRVANGGADLVQDATYTLKARDGDKASLGVVVVQLAARDTVQAPGLPPGVTATGVEVPAKGGEVTLTLTAAATAKPASGPIRVLLLATDLNKPEGVVAQYDLRKDRDKAGNQEFVDSTGDLWLTVSPTASVKPAAP